MCIFHWGLQVANPARPDLGCRVAVAIAAQTLPKGTSQPRLSHAAQDQNGRLHPASTVDAVPGLPHKPAILDGECMKQGVAYLTPLLAHNLGYALHLAPFLKHSSATNELKKPVGEFHKGWRWLSHGAVEVKHLIGRLPPAGDDLSFRSLSQPGNAGGETAQRRRLGSSLGLRMGTIHQHRSSAGHCASMVGYYGVNFWIFFFSNGLMYEVLAL